jgi:hypothetical protein
MEKKLATKLNLAITKIGDLLLQKTISQALDGNPVSDVHLTIPNYQRPYKWMAKNVIQLLDDIILAKNENKETYRVGTLILHFDSKNSVYSIVDGQQRTITFALLLKALGEESISFLEQPLSKNSFNTRNIPSNFRTLSRRVDSISDNRDKTSLQEYVKNNCELIVVITEDLSEAFQFFDSQNARGKKLYPHDLLKAYHLREMNDAELSETEKVLKNWEDLDQKELSGLFSEYLYPIKEWIKGNRAVELNEHNIHKFKGVTKLDNFPYAQFYKGGYAYADSVNQSTMPFVYGSRKLKPFQLDTPIVAGKPFFDYSKHYFEVLQDIQNNDKYEGYLIQDNEIVKTLDLRKYKNGVGNRISRLMFDTSILLYVDRFCPDRPSKIDLDLLEQFLVFAFVWAYSLRAQYHNLGWQAAQNYIIGNTVKNSFNIYKSITEADAPTSLLSALSDSILPLPDAVIVAKKDDIEQVDENGIYQNYLYYFKVKKFIEG